MKSSLSLVVSLLLFAVGLGFGKAHGADLKERRAHRSTNGTPSYSRLNRGNVSTVFRNNGVSDIDVNQLNSGLVYPIGTGKTAVFETGFLWGGKVNGNARVGGSAYATGLEPGRILPDGSADNPSNAEYRMYRVRRDVSPYETGPDTLDDFTSEIADEGVPAGDLRAAYCHDWNEWPASQGAPFEDIDGDGVYTPSADRPGFPGADQTIWYVCNDLEGALTLNLAGSPPLGIEMQVTAWVYRQPGALGNTIFRKYLLINKSIDTIDSMYVAQWSDPDLGDAADDFAGCDSAAASRMGYAYNAANTDALYAPLPPPVIGFTILQGPVIPSAGDTARFRGRLVAGLQNLPMTSFTYFARGDANVTDPEQGSYNGTLQWYNYFRGIVGRTGVPFTDPQGHPTAFALAGDPVTGTGWIDGQNLPAGDRRIVCSSGPFTFAPSDTQEVVVAEIAAGAVVGVNRLTALGLLRYGAVQVRSAFDALFNTTLAVAPPLDGVPSDYLLLQNYPNPFNPSTTIEFGIPQAGAVSVRLYNLLGEEVAVLADGMRAPGMHRVSFDAGKLPSGMYVCRLTAGSHSASQKLLLVR